MNVFRRSVLLLLSFLLTVGLCGCHLLNPPPAPDVYQADTIKAEETTVPEETEAAETTAEETTVPEPVPEPINNADDTFEDGVFTVNNSDYVIPEKLAKDLMGVMNEPPYIGFGKAFYVLDLDTRMSIGYDADQYYMTACTIKAGYALSWFRTLEKNRLAEEAGTPLADGEKRPLLTDNYLYTGADYLVGAGKIQYGGTGVNYTIRDLLYHLINESDNTAYNILYNRIFGNEAYQELTKELGIVPYGGQYGMWTRLRALDLGLVWQAIWEYHNTHSEEADLYWEFLTHNEFCEIGKVVTDADEVAHKSGSDDFGFHEAGIVVRDGHAYAVVVLTTRPLPICDDDYDCAHKMIERIDPIMKDYYEWLKADND